jgi:tyrosyl-tRNA synthetase
MSISDLLMVRYRELLLRISPADDARPVAGHREGAANPMEMKKDLAFRLVEMFHDGKAAGEAEEHFARVHQRREEPEDMPVFELANSDAIATLAELIVRSGLAPSKTEARRLLKAGAVTVDGDRVTEVTAPVPAGAGDFVLRIGKLRFLRVLVR